MTNEFYINITLALTTLIFTFLILYYLETFICFRMLIFLYVLLLALLGFMGDISFGVHVSHYS